MFSGPQIRPLLSVPLVATRAVSRINGPTAFDLWSVSVVLFCLGNAAPQTGRFSTFRRYLDGDLFMVLTSVFSCLLCAAEFFCVCRVY